MDMKIDDKALDSMIRKAFNDGARSTLDLLIEWADASLTAVESKFQDTLNPELGIKSDMWAVFISKMKSLLPKE